MDACEMTPWTSYVATSPTQRSAAGTPIMAILFHTPVLCGIFFRQLKKKEVTRLNFIAHYHDYLE